MPTPVLILSGPVGAGKTTVARDLIRLMPSPVAYIEGDRFWSFIVKGATHGPTPESFRVIMASMMAAAVPFATPGSRVVLDFSIPPWFLPTAKVIASVRQVPLDYVVLRPSEQVCAARAAARPGGQVTDYTRYHELYQEFDEAKQYVLDDDLASAEQMATRILEGVSGGRFRLG